MKKKKYKIEKSTCKKDCAEVYVFNKNKGYYNFINYIPIEQVNAFIKLHSSDEVLLKVPSEKL